MTLQWLRAQKCPISGIWSFLCWTEKYIPVYIFLPIENEKSKKTHTFVFISLLFYFLFHQQTGAGDEGGGQSLTSPGSCLKDFRTHPIIECQGARGSCHYYTNLYSFWLTAVRHVDQFVKPNPGTIKAAEDQRRKASQCQVCFRQ